MHDEDFFHTHEDGQDEAVQAAVVKAILDQETLELLTVGIDIGSSTSHLLFARVFFQREGHRSADRFVVIDRTIVWRSPIMFTPFLPDGTIDAHALSHFVRDCYERAGFSRDDVDSGAVILTGEAIKRTNARAIDEIFAAESGKFVCATAGHRLESTLAAHGSGATALSRRRGQPGLHVDIGGGTTKMALVVDGEITDVAAFAVGGRLIARDGQGVWTRVDDSARMVAEELGLAVDPGGLADPETRDRLASRLAEVLVDEIVDDPLDALGSSLELTDHLRRAAEPQYVTISGGVAEYVFGHTHEEFGDIAPELARAVIKQLSTRLSIPCIDPGEGIRATVIGASQFTVQVSGTTLHISGGAALPVQNVPVVRLPALSPETPPDPIELAKAIRAGAEQRDADLGAPVCLAVRWTGSATYERLAALAHAIADVAEEAVDPATLLAVVIDADIAQLLGRVLREDLGVTRGLVVIDGIELNELDFVDIGELIEPPGVVPVVIKSLLFA
ncbi:ethanolamine ammonia-lyase reactivating factor EutA [Aeromicrobium wangtongii]|uniref:ethanolamine ammonia-lyase reactivating factor EutA n=1 Tax=Aeromicrobium wangtongii TaxID=2969247 RepID=UPI002016E6E3|nr:ethanolamine ammonia-lyase reactivating factor EutA [Aeromicrobium wangtongii]MCL3817652.1 ethanolamine ammonia-lyase reactivating factor EutA [Aeromicrobium wangtongii]